MKTPNRSDLETVQPLSGLAPWVGSKRNLAARLISRIEAIPHTCYAEPFIGMGGVFLRRRWPAKSEAINDWSREVATLFRIVQRHPQALFDEVAGYVTSVDDFIRLAKADPDALTDIERAARLLFLQHCAYGGKPGSLSFGRSPLRNARWKPSRIEERLRTISRRLTGVVIDRLPYDDFIRRWDRPTTLFYCDPPYWGCETYYGKGLWSRDDFARLAEVLRNIQGRFILSINDRPEIRALFDWARIEEESMTYSISRPMQVTELVISNG